MKLFSTLLIGFLLFSCDLTDKTEPTFSCEKNAPIIVQGQDECGFARITKFSKNFNKTETMVLEIGFATGGFKITIHTLNGKIKPATYKYPSESELWFNQLNRGKSGSITITSIDSVNKLISGKFKFEAEGNANSQAYNYSTEGRFNKVSY